MPCALIISARVGEVRRARRGTESADPRLGVYSVVRCARSVVAHRAPSSPGRVARDWSQSAPRLHGYRAGFHCVCTAPSSMSRRAQRPATIDIRPSRTSRQAALQRVPSRRKRARDDDDDDDDTDDDLVIRSATGSSNVSVNNDASDSAVDENDDDDDETVPRSRTGSRRSARDVKASSAQRGSDADDLDEYLEPIEDDDDANGASGASEDDDGGGDVIEKIIARRVVTPSSGKGPSEEFLVKYKDVSYVHCEWIPRAGLEATKADRARLNRFLQNEGTNDDDAVDVDGDDDNNVSNGAGQYFPSDYCRVDRIVAHRSALDAGGSKRTLRLADLREGKHWDECEFLVRWMQQGYDEATWEPYSTLRLLDCQEDVRNEIMRYFRFVEPLPIATPKPAPTKKETKKRSTSSSRNNNAATAAWKAQSFPVLAFANGLALRDYQVDGVKWMSFNWAQGRNSILADEMGLGKTVQIAAFISHLHSHEGVPGPFLIVAPLSTLQHWRRECEAWAPKLNCLVYHGGAIAREIIREYEFKYDKKFAHKPFKFDIFVTSYEMVLADAKVMSRINWDLLVVDESHRLKNRDSKLFKELVRFKVKHCVMLTGTPVQNSIDELWVLLHFLDSQSFDSLEEFQAKFGDLKRKEDVDALHSLLKPYFLRRMKGDVEKDLPDRQEIVIDVEMTMLQKRLYKAIYEKNTEFLFQKSSVPSLMNIGMQLRKCCNHPYLIRGVEEDQVEDSMDDDAKMDRLVAASGKFVLLDKLLPKLKSEGHRVLIFSQMVRMLDIIEDYLNHRSYSYERIDGNIRGSDRQTAIDNFTRTPDIFIFMLATRAGGVGINLTAADTVIIFDSDWNPQNDLQAQARCHRIGQTQHVKVYRLITKNTYEMAMFNRASMKLGLDQAVLHPMTTSVKGSASEKLTKKEIENLLKNGAYSIVEDKSDEKSKAFCEKDIDDILASSSRIIQFSSKPSMTGSSFAKASFVITTDDGEEPLDIDDPNFWQKVGFRYEPSEKENDLILFDSRKRRRVQRFVGSYSGLDDARPATVAGGATSVDDGDYHQEDSEGTQSDDEEDVDAGPVTAGAPPSVVKKEASSSNDGASDGGWSNRDRDAFLGVLSNFGYGRWDIIRQHVALEELRRAPHVPIANRSDDDLRYYALCLLAMCVAAENAATASSARRTASSPVRNLLTFPVLAADLRALLHRQNPESTWEAPTPDTKLAQVRAHLEAGLSDVKLAPAFERARFKTSVVKKSRSYLHSLERCYVLQFSIERVCVPEMNFHLLAECANYKLTAAVPCSWWTIECDAALIQGCHMFGHGNFDAINNCESLSLYHRLKAPSTAGSPKAPTTEEVAKATADDAPPEAVPPDAGEGDANVEPVAHADEAAAGAAAAPVYPSSKSLTFRLRALLTNLGKQVYEYNMTQQQQQQQQLQQQQQQQMQSMAAPHQTELQRPPGAPVPADIRSQAQFVSPDAPYDYSSQAVFDPAQAAAQALHPNAPQQQQQQQPQQYLGQEYSAAPYIVSYGGGSQMPVSGPGPVVQCNEQFGTFQNVIIPLQFVAEYRSLQNTSEVLIEAFPSALMDVLHKAHYLNGEFERKEAESRQLAATYPALKGPVDGLGDNAKELAALFRRVRRRTNKMLHIQQMLGQWAEANGFGADVGAIPADAPLPADLMEKRSSEADLRKRVGECLGSAALVCGRNSQLLLRLEHLAS
ncbi:SNF2-related domain containing protein [Plasmodiophora brassicae]